MVVKKIKMVTGFDAEGAIVEDLSEAKMLIEAEFNATTGILVTERISIGRDASWVTPRSEPAT